jgi:3-isopropylmalate/(R)-2-methylmalate dehydratase large subunit
VSSPQSGSSTDFNLISGGQSFWPDQLRIEGRSSRRPRQHLAVTDHYLPTTNRSLGPAGIANVEIRRVVEMLDENATEFALPHIGMHHVDQGIAHVIAPELGFAQPGMLITCNDSHTARRAWAPAGGLEAQSTQARAGDADRLVEQAETMISVEDTRRACG